MTDAVPDERLVSIPSKQSLPRWVMTSRAHLLDPARTESPVRGERIVLIANPVAGGGRAVAVAARAAGAMRAAGHRVELVLPPSVEALRATALIAADTGVAALIAVGGDGTAHFVAQQCLETDTVFGLIPAGTGDDNARSMGITRGDPQAAAAAILDDLVDTDGTGHRMDVGRVTCGDDTTHAFLGVLSTGFDSAVNERANRMHRLGGTGRYMAALAGELRSFTPLDYRILVDDVVLELSGMLASIGNGRSYGGGMLVCPDAVSTDGLLDVTVLEAVTRPEFIRVFPSVFRGTHIRHPRVRTMRGSEISIAARGAVAYADGERLGPLPIQVHADHAALRVLGMRPHA